MLVDTHCHINIMVKDTFDTSLSQSDIEHAQTIVNEAASADVTRIINVGTSLIESKNCIQLAQQFSNCFAAIGIHPNDLQDTWQKEVEELKKFLNKKELYKIVAIGEIGFDKHYKDYNLQRQKDAFKAQVELALEYNLPILVHTRDAYDETLYALDAYSKEPLRGLIHCFSEDQTFADEVMKHDFLLGIGGTLTYPKNEMLRTIFKNVPLKNIVLETDAPYLPPQSMRGKKNHPKYIKEIAEFLAELRECSFEEVAEQTTTNANQLFALEQY